MKAKQLKKNFKDAKKFLKIQDENSKGKCSYHAGLYNGMVLMISLTEETWPRYKHYDEKKKKWKKDRKLINLD